MSEFWKRVDEELEFLGKNRAFLSKECAFSLANIGKGIKLGSTPSADTAVKIATVLGVSVEYLVNGAEEFNGNMENEKSQLHLYRKYRELIEQAERLTETQLKAIVSLIKTM